MSAAKRRIKRKIAQLVRMDDTRRRMLSDMRTGLARAMQLWRGPMAALSRSMKPYQRDLAILAIAKSRIKHGERP